LKGISGLGWIQDFGDCRGTLCLAMTGEFWFETKKTAKAVFYNNGGEGFAAFSQTTRHVSDGLYQDQIPPEPQTKKRPH
jgi:hypothetical protein